MKSSIKQKKYYNQNKDNEDFKLRIAIRNRENYLKRKLKSQSLKQLNISDNQDSNIIVNKLEINEPIETVKEIIPETKPIEPIETVKEIIPETKPIVPIETVKDIIPETKPIEPIETVKEIIPETKPIEPIETVKEIIPETKAIEPIETVKEIIPETKPIEPIETVKEIIPETKAIEPISNNIIETKPIEQTIINILKTPENNELLKTIENDSDNENDLEFNNTIDIIKNVVKEIAIQKLNEDLDLKRQSKYYDNQLKHFKNKGFNNADIKPINKIYNNTTPKNDNINLFKTKRNLRQIIKNLKPKTLKRIITHFS